MLSRLLFFFAVIFAVEAVRIKDILVNYPELKNCMPTFEMFDASGKFPISITSGNQIDFGNFDQCLGINEKNNKSEVIKGKYCLMNVGFSMNSSDSQSVFKAFGKNFFEFIEPAKEISRVQERADEVSITMILGWCVRHTCPIDEFAAFMSYITDLKITPLPGSMCQTKEDLKIEYNTGNIILITFLAFTLFLMILSTLYDMYIQCHKRKPAHIILIAFSVKTNGQKLLSINNNPHQLACLNGIRFLSMMWVMIAHRFMSSLSDPKINMKSIVNWLNEPANMYILNGTVSVDSFLVLSGILVAYGYCLAKDKGVKFNIILFYLHRYLRLTPVLAVMIWISGSNMYSFFGSGPLWPNSSSALGAGCREYWWASLLYIQNYYNNREMCLGHTWYLSVDMQLFILAPIILIPLWKWPKQTMLASTVLILASMASSFAVTYVNNLMSFISLQADINKYMINYYYTTHTRFGPWLMGLMLGYYLFKLKKTRNTRITLHPAQVAFGWIVGMGLLLSTLFAGHDLAINPDKLGNSFFNGFCRHGWALGLCWVIYACTQGYGGPVNAFLSWSLFQILGRFTYTVYLVHIIIQNLISASIKTHTYFSNFNTMYTFWGDFMFSLAISVCLTLAYESPMITIEKVLFKTGHKPKKPELPVHHNPSTSEDGQINNESK